MTRKLKTLMTSLLILMGVVLLFELVRDASRAGDFVGYVNAGNAVLSGQDIYADYLNTWPPFFSVFSVLLALGDGLSSYGIRFIWLLGSILAMYGIVDLSSKLLLNRRVSFRGDEASLKLNDTLIVVPLLISMRYIMDNLANVQINIFMLYCGLLGIYLFTKKQYLWVGLLLGLTISLKVYPIFILFYFLYKRELKPVLWTLCFLVLFNAITFVVFGIEETTAYFQHWVSEVAPRSYVANHKNQSVFGLFLRFLTSEDPDHNLYVNFLSLDPHKVKLFTYGAVGLAALIPVWLFRHKLANSTSLKAVLEYTLIFTAIPILSPIAWKAYFIFLWVPYFVLYVVLYQSDIRITGKTVKWLKALYLTSIVLTVGTTELLIGNHLSDVTEAYSAITFGTLILLVIIVQLYVKRDLININHGQ